MKKQPGIYKRGRIWWITYMLGGKQCFESSHSTHLRDAEKLLIQRKTDIGRGRIVIAPSKAPHFSELLDSYISQIENAGTRKRYVLARGVLIQKLGDPVITNLSPYMFDRFKSQRLEDGVTPAGVNRELALARASLNSAVERRLVPFSPFSGVTLFNEAKNRRPPTTPDSVCCP